MGHQDGLSLKVAALLFDGRRDCFPYFRLRSIGIRGMTARIAMVSFSLREPKVGGPYSKGLT